MSKLFALEEEGGQTESSNDLLIDKLLDRKKEETSPLSLTADLLKRRSEITKDIQEQLASDGEEEESGTEEETVEEEEEVPSEDPGDEEEEEAPKKNDKDDGEEESKKGKKSDKDDEGSDADDEGDLENLIGSGLGGSSDEEAPKQEETTTESFRHTPTLRNCFEPLRHAHQTYLASLESFGIAMEAVKETEQPIVYVKEAVLESINNLTAVAFNYIGSNETFTERSSEAVHALNERLAVFTQLVAEGKYHFTHKLISDKDILTNISYTGHSSIRETVRALTGYVRHSNTSSSSLLNSDFDELKSAFLTQEFTEDGSDLVYTKPVPGFNLIKASIVPYVNYLKTKIEDFQFYKLKVMKTEDLYSLPAISITEDNDISYIVESLNGLLISLTVSIDTLNGVTGHFNEFVDSLKVIGYNVQNDEYKNLAELGIDNKVKDFIKFKLIMEISYININLVMDYMTSVISALNIALELKE